jgi:demethoxyubiquinone hydroxylase (CLK1/Coq7/Cat5 family)
MLLRLCSADPVKLIDPFYPLSPFGLGGVSALSSFKAACAATGKVAAQLAALLPVSALPKSG